MKPTLPAALGHVVYSACNRNEYYKQEKKMLLESMARPARKTNNLTDICEQIV
jgi:hypothetical protein